MYNVRVRVHPVSDSEGMLEVCDKEHLRHVNSSGSMCRQELMYLYDEG